MNIDTLKECFEYEPQTGALYWKERPSNHFSSPRAMKITNSRLAGTKAGTPQKTKKGKTYLYVRVGKKSMLVHRICYMLENGKFNGEIDHINGDGTDNRLSNLRCVTRVDNSRNQRLKSSNTSGRTGVTWHKAASKWHAQITVNGKNISLGLYAEKSDAIKARDKADAKYGFHDNHGSKRSL